jgi:hypothetical protein
VEVIPEGLRRMNEIEGINYYEYGGLNFKDDFDNYLHKKYIGQFSMLGPAGDILRWGIDLDSFEGDIGREIFYL